MNNANNNANFNKEELIDKITNNLQHLDKDTLELIDKITSYFSSNPTHNDSHSDTSGDNRPS